MNFPPVPQAYVGVWRRTLLETPARKDTTTRVYWLQTPTWHGDIRIPADRPSFAGRTALVQLDRDEARTLARQQGFAGITQVEGDICRWHRAIDYQPPSGFNDVGRMHFDSPDRLLEYGVEQNYFEVWERVAIGGNDCNAREGVDANGARTLLLTSGSWFLRVRARGVVLPPAADLGTLVDAASSAIERAALLGCEISCGRRLGDSSEGRIEHSTLPWREGAVQSLTTP